MTSSHPPLRSYGRLKSRPIKPRQAALMETLLPALLSLHHEQDLPLVRLFEATCLAPARLLGLPCGRLARGAPADLVLVDIGAPVSIDAETLLSKSKNSPFDGRRLQGKVLRTLVGGRAVHSA